MTAALPMIPANFLTQNRLAISELNFVPFNDPKYPKQNMVLNGGFTSEEYQLKHWLKMEGAKNIKVKRSRTSSFISIAFLWE